MCSRAGCVICALMNPNSNSDYLYSVLTVNGISHTPTAKGLIEIHPFEDAADGKE
jgi:hypothetical protein